MSEKRTKQLIIRVSPTEFETLTRQKTHPKFSPLHSGAGLEDGKASDKKTSNSNSRPKSCGYLQEWVTT